MSSAYSSAATPPAMSAAAAASAPSPLGAGCLFFPVLEDRAVVCAPAAYVLHVVRELLANLARCAGKPRRRLRPALTDDEILARFGRAVRDADDVTYYVDVPELLLEVEEEDADGPLAVWMPPAAAAAATLRPDPMQYERVYVLINAMRGRVRRTQQEHYHANHPSGRFVIVFSDEVTLRPRVPCEPLPPGARHVRALAGDAAVRACPENTRQIASLLHGRFRSVRTVAAAN